MNSRESTRPHYPDIENEERRYLNLALRSLVAGVARVAASRQPSIVRAGKCIRKIIRSSLNAVPPARGVPLQWWVNPLPGGLLFLGRKQAQCGRCSCGSLPSSLTDDYPT